MDAYSEAHLGARLTKRLRNRLGGNNMPKPEMIISLGNFVSVEDRELCAKSGLCPKKRDY